MLKIVKTEDMKNPKGMYWNGTRYVKAKGSGTWTDPDYYANGGPAKFWELPSPSRTPGAEGMVDYGSMYSLPNKGLFQKSTDSEWEGFGNPANLMNQPRQPQMQSIRPMQPMQKATVNKKSFYEADGEGDYSIDAVRSQYMNGGNIQVPYMAGQPKLSYGGVLGKQYNNPQYTHVTGLAKYGGVLGNQYNNPEYTHVTGLMKDGGIHIKPENKGKFTAWAQSHGMGVQEAASHVMANKDDYSSTIVKRANFAANSAHWNKKQYGGYTDEYANGGMIKRGAPFIDPEKEDYARLEYVKNKYPSLLKRTQDWTKEDEQALDDRFGMMVAESGKLPEYKQYSINPRTLKPEIPFGYSDYSNLNKPAIESVYTPSAQEEVYKNGGMIKRADGSYSKRGLWDNIRANAGSGKEPTREMLKQERKIRANQKMYGGPTRYNIGGKVTEENPMGGATMFTGQNPAGTSTTVATETTYDPATDPNNPVNQNIPMPQQGGYAAAQGAAYDTTGITDSQPDQAAPPAGPKQPRQPFGTGYRNLLGAAMMYGQYAADRRQQKGLKAYGIQQGMTQMNPVATGMNKGQYNQQGQLQQQFSAPGRFGRYGGSMQPEYAIGGEYEMDDATIEALSRKGYKIKYM